VEGDPIQSTPVAEAPVAEAAPPSPESTARPQEAPQAPPSGGKPELKSIEDAVRESHAARKARADVSGTGKQPAADPEPKPATEQPAPESSGGVNPDAPTPEPGRRSKEAQANLDRIADLERQLAERDPEKIRQQVLDEQAQQAISADDAAKAKSDGERFLHLNGLPDDDPELSEGDNWKWLQEQKKLRVNYPKAVEAITAQAHAEADRKVSEGLAGVTRAWEDTKSQLVRLGQEVGADFDAYLGKYSASAKSESPFYEMGKYLVSKATADTEAKVRGDLQPKLDKALQDARDAKAELARHLKLNGSRGLGAIREAPTGGRSGDAGAAPRPDFATASADDLLAYGMRQQAERAAAR